MLKCFCFFATILVTFYSFTSILVTFCSFTIFTFLLLRLINLGKQLMESYKSSKKVDKIVSRFPPLYTICKWNEALYSIVKVMVTKTHNRVIEAVSKPDHGFILELGVPQGSLVKVS